VWAVGLASVFVIAIARSTAYHYFD